MAQVGSAGQSRLSAPSRPDDAQRSSTNSSASSIVSDTQDDETDGTSAAAGADEWSAEGAGNGVTGEVKYVALPDHAFYCFDVLYDKLRGSSSSGSLDASMVQRWKGERYPLFVTWNIKKAGYQPHLRGCIGNFSAMDLEEGLRDYASISAFKDRRFSPIALRELSSLSCSVSLLHSFEPCLDYLDWQLGRHGIHIFFPDPKSHPPPIDSSRTSQAATPRMLGEDEDGESRAVGGRSLKNRLLGVAAGGGAAASAGQRAREASIRTAKTLSATYLPDVATDQGWNQRETIDSAIRKGGYDGKITEAIRRTLKVERYQSSKVSVTYTEWKDWRAANGRPVTSP